MFQQIWRIEKVLASKLVIEYMKIQKPDAIIIGSGLAGLTTALQVCDRGGKVVLIEKEEKLGGNSIKASSGINACRAAENGTVAEDEIQSFIDDTMKAAGSGADKALVETLVKNSFDALLWLRDRLGLDITKNHSQLGGHSRSRTHRPAKGAIGFSIVSSFQNTLKECEEDGRLEILTSTRVKRLIQDSERTVTGIEATSMDGQDFCISASNIILATGGFAADRSPTSVLAKNAPEYLHFPATFGGFSTGDGLAIAAELGASTVNLDKVQVHPTGFVDPSNPSNPSKFLCAELMRGIGGILLNARGERFCNELGTRDYVTAKMLEQNPLFRASNQKWNPSHEVPSFFLVLPEIARVQGGEHMGFYEWKKLLMPYKGISELSQYLDIGEPKLRKTLEKYKRNTVAQSDEFGKTNFPGEFSNDLDNETFYAGKVTPVLHYCMGGLKIDTHGKVLNEDGRPIPGLFAVGESSGGVHGYNRLAGNSLLECLVFGSIIGNEITLSN